MGLLILLQGEQNSVLWNCSTEHSSSERLVTRLVFEKNTDYRTVVESTSSSSMERSVTGLTGGHDLTRVEDNGSSVRREVSLLQSAESAKPAHSKFKRTCRRVKALAGP